MVKLILERHLNSRFICKSRESPTFQVKFWVLSLENVTSLEPFVSGPKAVLQM